MNNLAEPIKKLTAEKAMKKVGQKNRRGKLKKMGIMEVKLRKTQK